jgi:hypothetical protein
LGRGILLEPGAYGDDVWGNGFCLHKGFAKNRAFKDNAARLNGYLVFCSI